MRSCCALIEIQVRKKNPQLYSVKEMCEVLWVALVCCLNPHEPIAVRCQACIRILHQKTFCDALIACSHLMGAGFLFARLYGEDGP